MKEFHWYTWETRIEEISKERKIGAAFRVTGTYIHPNSADHIKFIFKSQK